MHFGTKSYLKNTRNHTAKHALSHANATNTKQPQFKSSQSQSMLA